MANEGKIIIVAGLDGDFRRRKFGHLMELIPKAEKVQKRQSVCQHCGAPASFTQRIF